MAAVWCVLAGALLVVLLAAPASAHTALVGSTPAGGERLAYPPDEVVLTFAVPVDTATTTVRLRHADGAEVPLEPLTAAGRSDVVAFGVPRLPQDVYGLTYESVGDDGHRVTGEVVFGVGAAPGSAQVATGGPDPLATGLDGAALVARVGWYLGLALGAGVLVLRGGPQPVGALATRRAARAAQVLAGAALARGVVGAATVLEAGGGAGRAFGSRPTVLWMVLAVALWAWGRRGELGRTLPWLLGSAVLVGTVAGHAPARPDPVLAVTFGATHVAAAAVWVGPLLVLVLASRAPAWRALPADERRAALLAAVRRIGRPAGWALLAVGASGGLLALRAWDGDGLGPTFAVALAVKVVAVVAVAVPLGVLHHRRRDRWTARPRPSLPRSVHVEVAVLVVATVLGGLLVGVDPGWSGGPGGTDPALTALLDGRAADPAACAELDVGRAACYRTALEQVLVAEGPQAAIDRVAALSEEDDHVAANCHQVAHDLGNDASERIDDMATALAVEGSVCWSGYYHGFVEARLASVTTDDLAAELPTFCDGAADPAYSFTHYNCLHGLGHGLMLRVDADLFAALPLCEAAGEEWAVRSCASGVFMENVMAAQQGLETDGVDETDLLHPCPAVDERFAEDCYLMQTSHILWRLDGDLPAAFGWCDDAPADHRDSCYRSMGRDISSRAALDAAQVVAMCRQGQDALVRWCIDGAASNAVYEQAGTDAADALCAAVTGDLRTACTAARDQAAAVVAAG